jgi:hypothetical protein
MSIGIQTSHPPTARLGGARRMTLSLGALFVLIALANLWVARALDPAARHQADATYVTT